MLNEKEFFKEENDCAKLLGKNLDEYRRDIKNTKIFPKKQTKKRKYDNSILKFLGLTIGDLKLRKEI